MDRVKKTARKSTGGLPPRVTNYNSNSMDSVEASETMAASSSYSATPPKSYPANNNLKRDATKAGFPSIKASPDVSPMELQIRELELMEEQCDSLEKLVEIAMERRDLERQMLETQREMLDIKKKKLSIYEKTMKKQ